MEYSRSSKQHNPVDYFILTNGKVDVFLRKNEVIEKELLEDGTEIDVYVAEEVYLQVGEAITKEHIEQNFDLFWNQAENPVSELSIEERLKVTEDTLNFILGL